MSIQRILVNTATAGITMFWAVPVFATLGTIGAYQYLNDKMEIKNIMTGLYIFGQLQFPISALPYCITCIIDTIVALKRIEVLKIEYYNYA
jgi:ABC-type multidrug transport system fused ATPase/permease subunit